MYVFKKGEKLQIIKKVLEIDIGNVDYYLPHRPNVKQSI